MGTKEMSRRSETKEDLAELLEVLDERSRAILWHLWWNRHAPISELRSLINVASDCEVLFRLKEVINGKSRELWGRPAVSFEESKIDPFTGEKVLFRWWLVEGDAAAVDRDRPLVDMFQEKDSVTIVVQLPGWDDSVNPKAEDKNSPSQIKVNDVKYRNGILQVRLKKGDSLVCSH
jgi:hypothetical protein